MNVGPMQPLTPPQRGMWACQQLDPASPALWTAEAVELRGALDVEALLGAITRTLAACDALHRRYVDTGTEVQQQRVAAWVDVLRLDFGDARDPMAAAHAWMREDRRAAPDLAHRPLFATALVRIGPDRHLWYLRAHHIALDGYGYLLLIHRVAECYSAAVEGVCPPPARDWSLQPVIEEAEAYAASPECRRDRAFWQEELAAGTEPVSLAPLCPPDDEARVEQALLPASTFARWQTAARGGHADIAGWLLAVAAIWMHRHTATREPTFGLLVMNRLGSAALAVPCMAMNVIPVRVPLAPERSVRALVADTAARLQRLRRHARYNYEWLRRDFGLGDGYRQLYGPVLNLMPFDRRFRFSKLESRAWSVSTGSVDDLDIAIAPIAEGLRLDFAANPRAYDGPQLATLHGSFRATADLAAAHPEATLDELARLLSTGCASPRAASASASASASAPMLPAETRA